MTPQFKLMCKKMDTYSEKELQSDSYLTEASREVTEINCSYEKKHRRGAELQLDDGALV